MVSADVLEAQDPLKAFSDALLNFHNHYYLDDYTSVWCQCHPKVYLSRLMGKMTTHINIIRKKLMEVHAQLKPLRCIEQYIAFLKLL